MFDRCFLLYRSRFRRVYLVGRLTTKQNPFSVVHFFGSTVFARQRVAFYVCITLSHLVTIFIDCRRGSYRFQFNCCVMCVRSLRISPGLTCLVPHQLWPPCRWSIDGEAAASALVCPTCRPNPASAECYKARGRFFRGALKTMFLVDSRKQMSLRHLKELSAATNYWLQKFSLVIKKSR